MVDGRTASYRALESAEVVKKTRIGKEFLWAKSWLYGCKYGPACSTQSLVLAPDRRRTLLQDTPSLR